MTISIDNIPVNYYAMGPDSDEAVVMLHGGGANCEPFRGAATGIAAKDKTVAPDVPGFG